MGGDNWVRNPLIADFNLSVVEVPKTSYAHSCFKSPAKVEFKHSLRVGMDHKLEEVTKVHMTHGAHWRTAMLPILPQALSQEAN